VTAAAAAPIRTADQRLRVFVSSTLQVRKLLVKRIWARSFRGCLKYAHNASIAL